MCRPLIDTRSPQQRGMAAEDPAARHRTVLLAALRERRRTQRKWHWIWRWPRLEVRLTHLPLVRRCEADTTKEDSA